MTSPTEVTIPSSYDGTNLCLHVWNKNNNNEVDTATTAVAGGALVVIYHGFLSHGLYPTVRYAAEFLISSSSLTDVIIVAPDARGHGKSGGISKYLPSKDVVLTDAIQVLQYANEQYNTDGKRKIFLLGSSMGGTIALYVANTIQKQKKEKEESNGNNNITIAGVVLLAPMLKLNVDIASRYLLAGLSFVIPTLSIIPSASTNLDKQYRDTAKRLECQNDPYTENKSTIRVASAATCVELASSIQSEYSTIQVPFLLLIADEDVVVQNDPTLYEVSPSTDKEIKHYPALHGLLCEPKPLVDTIQNDILHWIQKRL